MKVFHYSTSYETPFLLRLFQLLNHTMSIKNNLLLVLAVSSNPFFYKVSSNYQIEKGFPIMNRKEIIAANEISEVRTFTLNGFEQKVMIEGKTKDLPVLITLHGGPGSPGPFGVSARGLFKELTDKCILVCWDQLGCGANYKALDDSFGVDSFVAMTSDLIEEIKKLLKII